MNIIVSVILPVHNGGDFLGTAVDSILRQSFTALELILVDDHSNDSAIRELPTSDSRLIVLKSPGRGVSKAFNAGLARAAGRYIARMDADDISLPGRILRQLEYFETHPEIAICGTCVELFSGQELGGGNARYQSWLNACRTPEQISRELFIESPIPNPTAMFRKDVLLRLGGYQDPEWPEDYDLFLRADALGMRMGKPEETLLLWRDHPGRLTHNDHRYGRGKFQAAKASFLSRHRLKDKGPVLIWGAGPGGRTFHDLLQAQGTPVKGFLDVHPRRIGGQKRGLPVWPIGSLGQMKEDFTLVAVGSAGVRPKIRKFMSDLDRIEGEHYLFVV